MKIWYWILDTLYQLRIRIIALSELPEFINRPILNKDALVVVMVQGFRSKVAAGRLLAKFLVSCGYPVITVPELGNNTMSVPEGAKTVADKVASLGLKHVILACGSKGALVGKYILAHYNSQGTVKGMVAIAGAFGGTPLVRFIPWRPYRELLPTNPVIQELQKNTAINSKIVSIFPKYDNYLTIPGSSRLVGALDNVQVPYGGHNVAGFQKTTWEEVLKGIKKIENLSEQTRTVV